MFNLCKLMMNEINYSVLGHPLNVIKRSENLTEISEEIKKRVRDGCPVQSLRVFKDVEFDVLCGVKYLEKKAE